jgi:hypothetical protein
MVLSFLRLNGIRVTELMQRSRVGSSVRILRITGDSCQLLGRCLQAESLPLKAGEVTD